MISELVRKRNVPHYNGGHEMFHDDMIIAKSVYWSEVIGIACTLPGRARLAPAQFIC